MKILVTGSEGMVGSALCPVLRGKDHDVVATDLSPTSSGYHLLDVRDRDQVNRFIESTKPGLVIHLAAETDVDRCEEEPLHAYTTNAVATEYVAHACARQGVRLLYVSTAGVFDGSKSSPYVESDRPNPVNVYGRAKLAGEHAVQQLRDYLIVRAGWMVGGVERDKKFAGKILRLLEGRRTLSVVMDKIGSPTFTENLSKGMAALIETRHTGVFHMTNRGVCSRYEFACKLVEYLGRKDVSITPITSDAFPLPAPRAASEAMQNERLQALGMEMMPTWQEALQKYVRQYQQQVNACASSS